VPDDLHAVIAGLYADGGAKHAVSLPGMAVTLSALRARGLVLGVATNDTAAGLAASLDRCDLLHNFDFTAGCDSGFGAKPEPQVILAFAAAHGLALNEIAMVGDSTHDMETARRAGPVLRVAVLSGTGTRADLAPQADVVLDSVCDLPALFSQTANHRL
jgi:phosphoglycolate phosphatase